jgi:signal transduction histidine kinase
MAGPVAHNQDNGLTELNAPRGDVIHRDRRAWVLALAFVTMTLVALVAIPLLVQRSVDRHRENIEASEPARTLLMGLQYNLVREMSALNQFALTGDSIYAHNFRQARSAEIQIWNDLAPLAASMGPLTHERFVQARTIAELWHQRLNEEELLKRGAAGLETLQAAEIRQRFEDVLDATGQFDGAIIQATQSNRDQIARAERSGLRLTLLSGALALLAAAVVGALVLRMRRLAIEADRRRLEAAEALAESARVAEARQRLLRGITHDVKNPLGAARGYAELLNLGIKGSLNADQEKLVQGVERSIDGALSIISDLLDLARADSGGISVHRISIDINEVARQAADDHRAAAEAAGHEISAQCADGRLECYTDPVRVRQVLDNLLSNAIKYTPAPGRIVVHTNADAEGSPLEGRAIAINVSDNGPGIPGEQRESIFDEFTRIDDNNSALKGHGLGLAIARRIARLLGGELGLVHTDEPGSQFVLWLPQREQRDKPRPTARPFVKRAARNVLSDKR